MFIITKWAEPEVKQYTNGNIVVGARYSNDSQQVVSQVCHFHLLLTRRIHPIRYSTIFFRIGK